MTDQPPAPAPPPPPGDDRPSTPVPPAPAPPPPWTAPVPATPGQAPPPPTPSGRAPLPPPPAPSAGPAGYYPQEAYYAGWAPASAPPRRRGRRALAVTLVVVLVAAVLGGGGVVLGTWLQTRPLGDVTGPTSATSRQVRAGHCLAELPDDGTLGRVTVVPCDDPHDAEVVGQLDLGEGAWPGADKVRRRAEAWCEMDTAETEAGLRPVVWTPTERSWAQGDRLALCLAWDAG